MALRVETGSESPVQSPIIREFTPQVKAEFLRLALRNKRYLDGLSLDEVERMDVGDAERFGAFEIQSIVLGMLGLDGLLRGDRSLVRMRSINQEDIDSLATLYRDRRKFYVKNDLFMKNFSHRINLQIKPEEAKKRGEMTELGRILTKLGQADLLATIDEEIGIGPGQALWERDHQVIWERERAKVRGELT